MQEIKSAEQAASAEGKGVSAADIGYKEKPVYDVLKRFGDIVCSLFALIVLSPLLIAVAAAIMIDDFGNPIYAQERTGKDSKIFVMYKFRSMRKNAEKERESLLPQNEVDGPLFKIADDPRVTRVGKFIRKTSIDELPQLINIIKGDMSIIGPRPLATYEQDACNEYQKQRLLVKPGLSCYTALEKNSKENFDHWIELDMKYIRERSVLTDIKIILRTIGVVLGLKNL
ncbi:MAG: sugar transferase [Oscillospiraceae bacterium]|nr:sugar transferase [Oscillospiraceae bacterium]